MCGRFTLTATIEQIMDRFDIQAFLDEENFAPNYNIAPSQNVLAIINDGKFNRMGFLKWGLIPPWAKDPSIGNKLINARAETISEKPSFRHAFKNKRCLIIADGFYEWKRNSDHSKTPMRIKLKSNSLFGMAGIWEQWKSPNGKSVFTCSIITTTPNKLMIDIHNRMPVILKREDEKDWLDPTIKDTKLLKDFLVPFDPNQMEAYQVSSLVNSTKNNSIELIQKIC
ncbi:SOS response-associated peptidase [Neobacillus thermocopriae]|uniref:Abasic site processing protein n=1 Tax=Neobacillus thermocopriae TaxID=1215031 RepID=A0A6B3TM67_9BACI|nr:SOS response-associated peptidase [Neobacillus thermocopriae]MED3623930.1 SOS response-associated peptidase [Neobacillus thermocopriae]MED3713875.1 SOS response-associated peptidase [Neobacillus thermocopriae]NEX77983.1 SOS response-associated peptidase [Neobacillus thermocopriae]